MEKSSMNLKLKMTIKLKVIFAVGLLCAISLPTNAKADGNNQKSGIPQIKAIETPLVHGYFIGVTGAYFTNNTSLGDDLFFLPWTTNISTWIAVPAEPEYAYQVELFDTNGVAMPKTKIGKKVGVKFWDFGVGKDIKIQHRHAQKAGEMTSANLLFRPSDLFAIDKPGIYTLRIRFQILAFPMSGPDYKIYTNDLIRFPPLDYQIIKR